MLTKRPQEKLSTSHVSPLSPTWEELRNERQKDWEPMGGATTISEHSPFFLSCRFFTPKHDKVCPSSLSEGFLSSTLFIGTSTLILSWDVSWLLETKQVKLNLFCFHTHAELPCLLHSSNSSLCLPHDPGLKPAPILFLSPHSHLPASMDFIPICTGPRPILPRSGTWPLPPVPSYLA